LHILQHVSKWGIKLFFVPIAPAEIYFLSY